MILGIMLLVCFASTAFTLPKSGPAADDDDEPFPELILPPPMEFGYFKITCWDEQDTKCQELNAEGKENHDKRRLEDLNKWKDELSEYGKSHWESQYPDTAKEHTKLSEKYGS